MSKYGYPKYSKSQKNGKVGESYFSDFVHKELGWVYRSVHEEDDFGIDGYVDLIIDESVTGRSIAVQIKCGDTYFKKNKYGNITYRGRKKDLNYLLNNKEEIIFVVFNSNCSEARWIHFNINIITQHERSWTIEIPNENILDKKIKDNWLLIAGPIYDFSDELEQSRALDRVIENSDLKILTLNRESIENLDFNGINSMIEKLSKDKKTLIEKRGALVVLISGYDEDKRELYEIPEVCEWYWESISIGIPWFYFLGDHIDYAGFKALLFCCCDVDSEKVEGKFHVVPTDIVQVSDWLENNLVNLNEFTERKNLPPEINEEMSNRAFDFIKLFVTD